MNCHIVFFCTGVWEDYSEKVLEVFGKADSAKEFAERFRKRLDEIGYHTNGDRRSLDNQETRYHGEIDGMSIDYNGAFIKVRGPYPFNP